MVTRACSTIAAYIRSSNASHAIPSTALPQASSKNSNSDSFALGRSIDIGEPFHARPWYPGLFGCYQQQQMQRRLGVAHPYVAAIEPLCKLLLPALGIVLELFLHPVRRGSVTI